MADRVAHLLIGTIVLHGSCIEYSLTFKGEVSLYIIKIWASLGLFLFIFVLFTSQVNYQLKKQDVLRIQPGAVGW